ncbi:MAG: aminotransferase class V-fold PLP-dependent enzyme [Nitriliruptoraceae bacterium]|nr:aminotransferase class V-fold PLP-dependent enzyme [Nitriliruptoraceae bacterium]
MYLEAFDPAPDQTDALLRAVSDLVGELVTTAGQRPVLGAPRGEELVEGLLDTRPPLEPAALEPVLAQVRAVLATGVDNAAAGELAYIPGSGLLSAALGDLIAAVANRYTGLHGFTPAAVALEQGVLRWLAELFELPERAQAVLLSGGSNANMTAIIAAREKHADGRADLACVYVGEHAHASVRKAARIAGIPGAQIRVCDSSDGARLDPEAVRIAVKQDLADGLIPIAIVGAAGTTNAGAVDPLDALADLAAELGVWFHVDAAYGGFFQLTARGRDRLAGIERADSITLDPHKSLFLPFGTGALLVRERDDLAAAFAEDADYLRDHSDDLDALPDFTAITPELTREWRGLRLWLPLQLHGVAAFRDALDRALDLAMHVYDRLDADANLEVVGGCPDLSIVTFRVPGDDAAQDALLRAVHADGRVRLSTTVIDARVALRLAVLSHRTTADTVEVALDLITRHAAAHVAGHRPGPVGREPDLVP